VKGIHQVLLGGGLLLQTACTSSDRDLAARALEEARDQLVVARALDAARFAPTAADRAERAFSEAETEVRRHNASLLSFVDGAPWQDKVAQALDLARIAAWVAETDRDRMRGEAQTWMWAAEGLLQEQSGQTPPRFPAEARSKVAEARLMLAEAEYLLDDGHFHNAVDRARAAYEVAGGAQKEVEDLLARFEDPANLRLWRSWVVEAREESRRSGRPALVVDKFQHRALLFDRGRLQRSYNVELGHKSLNPKLMAGDGATPEGVYRVLSKKDREDTSYHKALLLDYPNESDRQRFLRAKREGRIPSQARPGGLIEIHGDGGRGTDWTDGCVAVLNHEMDSLFEELSVGSLVTIVGRYVEEGGSRR
jgi:hypothetical protein